MPISQTDQLFKLIKSLTKAEKRNFHLYARRVQSKDSLKFIQLFELLDKQKKLDESQMFETFKDINKSQLPNLKRHLYKQILVSLRLIHIHKDSGITIREHIDFASILYGKGLYLQSLKILERARKMSEKSGFEILSLEIIERQKVIESRHITHTGPLKNVELVNDAQNKIEQLSNTILLSNLRHTMHGTYIKNGHVRNEADLELIRNTFENKMPPFVHDDLGFFAKIYLYQSFVWYYYIQLDFVTCLEYSLKWVNLFKSSPLFIDWDRDLYMRGYHYLITSAFNLRDLNSFDLYLEELEIYRKINYAKFNTNSKIISFLYVHMSRINKHILAGTFSEGVNEIPRTTRRISTFRSKLDAHRILIFYFKIAWIYFCNNQADIAIDYLNKTLNMKAHNLRKDVQGYSHLLLAMAHYELGNFDLLEYLVRSATYFYQKMKQVDQVQLYTLQFFKTISKTPLDKHNEALELLSKQLKTLQNNPWEKRAILYLDVDSWVKSKLEKKPMSRVVQELNESSN